MIRVFAPLKREYIIAELDGKTLGPYTMTFQHQDGMKLFFTCDPDEEAAVKVVKEHIKKTPIGPALNFMVDYVE